MILTLSHCFSTTAIFSGGGMVNVSPEREDIARRHCSKAGLFKKNKIIAGALEAFSTAIQFPFGMNTVAPVLASYWCPANVMRTVPLCTKMTSSSKRCLCSGILFPGGISSVPTHERLRSGCDQIDLENEWLGAQ
jgi:hypothetical protein